MLHKVKQKPLTDEDKTEILHRLEGATSVRRFLSQLYASRGGREYILNNPEHFQDTETLLKQNGWELKWTRKRKPRQKKITPQDEREAFDRIMSEE